MIANDNMITNDNNSTIYNHKKRKMNEEIIDYKELYEKEQRDNRMLKNEIRMIHITCVNLIERHNLMQTSITVLKVSICIYYQFKIIHKSITNHLLEWT